MKNNLTLQLQTAPAITLSGSGLTKYRKELIKVGKFVKDSVGLSFEVTRETLNHWADTFHRWITNGLKVAVPLGHGAADNPEKNAGWVLDMKVEGDSLIGIMELADPGLALTTDVSIYVPAEFVDGHGEKYIQPIQHVALCANPVIPGLKGFKELSLSLGDVTMDKKKLAKLLGLPEDSDEKAITAAIENANTKALSHTKPAEPVNTVLVGLVSENRAIKISGLVKAGLITPATQEAIAKQYTNPEALSLSLSGGWNDGFDFLVGIIAENKIVPLGEKSGRQLLELANALAAGEKNPIAADVEKRREDAGLKT